MNFDLMNEFNIHNAPSISRILIFWRRRYVCMWAVGPRKKARGGPLGWSIASWNHGDFSGRLFSGYLNEVSVMYWISFNRRTGIFL